MGCIHTMTEQRPIKDQILVVIHDPTAYVRVVGRGNFKNSVALKQFGTAAIDQDARSIVLDMTDCVGMDSTFMGVLAGLAFRLKQRCGGEILMVNLSPRTRSLLATLGLDRVIRPFMLGATPPEHLRVLEETEELDRLPAASESQRLTTETMIEAHENLGAVSEGNVPKFTDVLAYLRDDLARSEQKPEENGDDS